MRGRVRGTVARAIHGLFVELEVKDGWSHELHPTLILRQVYVLPLTGAPTIFQRRHDRDQAEADGDEINVGTVQEHRWAVVGAGQMGEAAERGELGAEAPLPGARASLPLVAGTEHDEVGVDFSQRLIAEPQSVHYPYCKVLDHHVGPGYELFGQVQAPGCLQIEGDAVGIVIEDGKGA